MIHAYVLSSWGKDMWKERNMQSEMERDTKDRERGNSGACISGKGQLSSPFCLGLHSLTSFPSQSLLPNSSRSHSLWISDFLVSPSCSLYILKWTSYPLILKQLHLCISSLYPFDVLKYLFIVGFGVSIKWC